MPYCVALFPEIKGITILAFILQHVCYPDKRTDNNYNSKYMILGIESEI